MNKYYTGKTLEGTQDGKAERIFSSRCSSVDNIAVHWYVLP
jgi:hypothetical protein